MSKFDLVNKTKGLFKRAEFKVKKHSPEILITTGVVGVVASTVMACRATTKVNDIISDAKEQIDTVHQFVDQPETIPAGKEYTPEDGKKDLTIIYTQTALKVAKLYAPAVILGTLSIGSIIASNNILRKRNAALTAAYMIVDKNFKAYRGRVVDRFGAELDRELRYDIKSEEVEETITKEDGTTETVKKTVTTSGVNEYSDYAKFFDVGNPNWRKNPEDNLYFIKQQEIYANLQLKTYKHLFLNDVYEMLGIPKTQAGQIVGWIYDEKNPTGDNCVSFGLYDDPENPAKRAFINCEERSVLLDFNVDGNILEDFWKVDNANFGTGN